MINVKPTNSYSCRYLHTDVIVSFLFPHEQTPTASSCYVSFLERKNIEPILWALGFERAAWTPADGCSKSWLCFNELAHYHSRMQQNFVGLLSQKRKEKRMQQYLPLHVTSSAITGSLLEHRTCTPDLELQSASFNRARNFCTFF